MATRNVGAKVTQIVGSLLMIAGIAGVFLAYSSIRAAQTVTEGQQWMPVLFGSQVAIGFGVVTAVAGRIAEWWES